MPLAGTPQLHRRPLTSNGMSKTCHQSQGNVSISDVGLELYTGKYVSRRSAVNAHALITKTCAGPYFGEKRHRDGAFYFSVKFSGSVVAVGVIRELAVAQIAADLITIAECFILKTVIVSSVKKDTADWSQGNWSRAQIIANPELSAPDTVRTSAGTLMTMFWALAAEGNAPTRNTVIAAKTLIKRMVFFSAKKSSRPPTHYGKDPQHQLVGGAPTNALNMGLWSVMLMKAIRLAHQRPSMLRISTGKTSGQGARRKGWLNSRGAEAC